MEDLKTWYRQNLASRIAELEDAKQRVDAGDPRGHVVLRHTAHALRGSGGTYGFPQISEAAAAVEDASVEELGPALTTLLALLRQVARPSRAPGGVLIVEDNTDLHRLLAARLRADGRQVFVAETAAQAEVVLAGEQVGAVVLDLILPDADGRNFLVRLRSDAATSSLPVLVMTTRTSAHIRRECLELGAAAFLEKPFAPDELASAVERVLQGEPQAPAPVPAPARTGPHPILVVEDDPLVASLLSHRLGREGFEVLRFGDGTEALAGIEGRVLSLAILDVKLPGMDGFQLLTRLRQQPQRAQTPIVMLTAMGKEEHVVRGLSLGADDYILKPFSPSELIARVRRLLQLSGRAVD